ncbi:hypothetical protein SSCHL_1446 [Staphylococcus schleiferi]|nr:hypothetical protein SSCHL_1446 [Staphylococcus schleiferi]
MPSGIIKIVIYSFIFAVLLMILVRIFLPLKITKLKKNRL